MFSPPAEIVSRVKGQYPTIEIRWNQRTARWELQERYVKGASYATRTIWEYENPDGSTGPLIGDRVMDFLHRADTRKWPLDERMKIYDQEWSKRKESAEKEFSERLKTDIVEDYRYIAGIPTFFMNPKYHYKAVGTPV